MINTLLVAALFGGVNAAQAADVPAGTKLAEVQQLVKGNGSEPATLDPHKTEGTVESNILRDLFEGLVSSGPKGEVLPAMAESWETKDNKHFVFHLRKNAKWSNGDPVTAHDFEYAFKRAVDPKTASPYSWYLEIPTIVNASDIIAGKKPSDTLGVKAVDDYTFEVQLEKAVPYFVSMLSHTTTYPVPKKVIEKFGDKWTQPGNMVSNGAYVLKDWVVNERVDVERNKNYWNDAKTVINKVTYLPIQSTNAELNRYLAGEVDLTYNMPIERFKQMKKDLPNEVKVSGYVGTYYYQYNFKKKPFDDVRVRTALSYAIDRNVIADKVMGKGETPGYTLVPDFVDGFKPVAPAWSKLTQAERDAKAKELLTEAGFGPGKPLKFELLYNTDDNHKKVAVAVASMWKKLGVQVSLVNQEWKTYLETKKQGQFDVGRAGWIADYNEASSMLDLMQTTHGNNDGKYSNLAFDKLMNESRNQVDAEARNKLYVQAEEILAKDMPIAPIYQYVTSRMVKPYVGGYPANPLDNLYSKDMYIIAH
ncbi:peptide ABC transporter substrate-binding protein [Aeromonas dhakensis]|nr:peptide ABC transporter substrate-binding protein [Aeromonas dhakensis]CAD7521073.1 peptide ABC transporter substrate-binding protein [Aeromonas dhakensis]CAD7541902.1 peptide ABC transporter substrate-binding protein [Aeromonas dhakensis]BED98567.1 peptide ABC transporter substrate-binding protein [Aeromonas dhakensis]BEE08860.1 peptide ABC transporter substrate-binding protein [Aeromonas dhakensis]